MRDQPAYLIRAIGGPAMHFAGAIDRVRRTTFEPAAMNIARLDQADADIAGDAAQHLAPADNPGDRRLVHAVLQRNDIGAGCEVLANEQCRPCGVVRLHADEGDVERRLFADMLDLGEVQHAWSHGERFLTLVMGYAQAVPLDLLDVLWPRVDERHILAGERHMRAGVATDSPGTDDRDLLLHGLPPSNAVLAGSYSATRPPGNQRGKPCNPGRASRASLQADVPPAI